jgi:hypothetical protein
MTAATRGAGRQGQRYAHLACEQQQQDERGTALADAVHE